MAKTRMYEPWGYQDENNYQGSGIILENDLDSFFADAEYNKDDNKIHFLNKDGYEKGTIDVSEFTKSQVIVEKTWYEDGKIHIKFINGDEIVIDIKEVLDETEFKNGLQVVDGEVSVLIDSESDDYLSVGESGVKLSGVKGDIEAEELRATNVENTLITNFGDEIARATQAESALSGIISTEISERIADVDAEESRATGVEATINNTIGGGFSTASTETITARFNELKTSLNDEVNNRQTQITTEASTRASEDSDIRNLINTEKTRAMGVEDNLNGLINEISGKVDTHTSDLEVHVTTEDKDTWNNKIDSSALVGYATEEWVGQQGFLTEHQDLSEYAKTSVVEGELALKADKSEIPTDFYTQEDVNKMMSQLLTRIENLESKEGVIVADNASAVATASAGDNLVLTSSDAIQALTSNVEYNTLTIVGGNSNVDIKGIASDKVTVDGMSINGDKGTSNGRMQISADTVVIKNVDIESGATAYNIFESSQNTAKSEYFTSSYEVSNVVCDNTELNHNIFNIYTLTNNAVVTIKDSYFNLDVDKSNVLRLANYTNATGVTINFENVDWNYENAEASDWQWAGLVIYQPSATDNSLNGDTSAIETWTFNFKNCKYNGEKVSDVNFGGHNQIAYAYDVNRSGEVTDLSAIATFNFE